MKTEYTVKEIIDVIKEDYKETDKIEIKNVKSFPNGAVMVFDKNGKQVGFLQMLLSFTAKIENGVW